MIIVPTILEQQFELASIKIRLIKDKTRWIQVDVIDGVFLKEKTFETELLKKLEKELENNLLEAHLMVKEPIKWVEKCNFVGITRVIGQVEMMSSREEFVEKVKDIGMEAGLAIDIDTEIGEIPKETDLVLLMGRKAGFGIKEIDKNIYKKIKELIKIKEKEDLDFEIGVDGGITLEEIDKIKNTGINIAYCGGAIFNGMVDDNWEKLNYASKN
jgi:ribulose-phosphate 3-epimerase